MRHQCVEKLSVRRYRSRLRVNTSVATFNRAFRFHRTFSRHASIELVSILQREDSSYFSSSIEVWYFYRSFYRFSIGGILSNDKIVRRCNIVSELTDLPIRLQMYGFILKGKFVDTICLSTDGLFNNVDVEIQRHLDILRSASNRNLNIILHPTYRTTH